MVHFDRQQSTRRSENAWSPQPPSPTRAANSVMALAPDDFMTTERLDPDHDVSSITWYPFDWTTGGPNSSYSPLRKSFAIRLAATSACSSVFIYRPVVRQSVSHQRRQIAFTGPFASPGDLITSISWRLPIIYSPIHQN